MLETVTGPTEPAPTEDSSRWGVNIPAVRQALKFIKRKGQITADELVEWDRSHGAKLFTWDDPEAAWEWRRHEARLFLNRFRARFEGMRVRAFIRVREDAEQGIDRDAYYTIESIAESPGMREQVIADVSKRMENLGGELAMWKLDDAEQRALFARLRAAMSGK